MKAIELYKWINDSGIEWHYYDNEGVEDVVIFPYHFQMEQFFKILSTGIFDDDGINCVIKQGYFAIWMNDICEYHDIELHEVFNKEDEP